MLKQRNFYPRQVAQRLSGKDPEKLASGEKSALTFFIQKSRKMRVSVSIAETEQGHRQIRIG